MRILEIFSQGPCSTRVTSGCSSSLSRVLSGRWRRETAKGGVKHTAWRRRSWESDDSPPDSCTMYRTNSSDLFSTLTDASAECERLASDGFPNVFPCVAAAAYPEFVEQQVEDLSRRHGAVDSHIGHWTVSRGEHRRLENKAKAKFCKNAPNKFTFSCCRQRQCLSCRHAFAGDAFYFFLFYFIIIHSPFPEKPYSWFIT